ncbi:MAG TPA: cation:proton antiporter [Polyangiaceae bacterium]|nr:cation:proton antiporter [Polyangiaceae bacterium]
MHMHERLEGLLLVLAVGAIVAIAAKRVGVPYNVALVLVGLALVLLDVLPQTPLDPEIVLVAFLPVLVFEGALFADAGHLGEMRGPILALAVPGVALSLVATAGVSALALGLPFAAALLLGALLSITDTVSVLLAFRGVRVPHRLAAIMEGESLFNDGTALVLVSLTASAVAGAAFDPVSTARSLVVAIAGGAAVGAAFAVVGGAVLRTTPDHLTAILASAVFVFGAALLAERAHASPVIAVVVVGLALGRVARRSLAPSHVLALHGFWETAGFGLNVLIFLLVGMQIEARMLIDEAASIGLSLVALHAGRAAAVYGCMALVRLPGRERVPGAWQHVMVAGNIKGSLSMAAALALPDGLPHRERILTIVFGVTFVTLVTQALPFRWLLRALGVALAAPDAALERARATLVAARRGQAELDELLAAGLVSRKAHAERRAAFQHQVIRAEAVLRAAPDSGGGAQVDLALLNAQKAALLDGARRGVLDAGAAAEGAGEIDRRIVELSGRQEGH